MTDHDFETNDFGIIIDPDEREQAMENAEWGDEYDDVPRYDDLSDEGKAEYQSFGSDFALAAGLADGQVPTVGTIITKECEGDTKAEALGKAYLTRDRIQENGGSCEVKYIEPRIIIGHNLYHEVEITITES